MNNNIDIDLLSLEDDRYYVLKLVCDCFGVSYDDILETRRRNDVVRKRGVVMHVCVNGLGISVPMMQEVFSRLNKSSLYSCMYRHMDTCEVGDKLYVGELEELLDYINAIDIDFRDKIIGNLKAGRWR